MSKNIISMCEPNDDMNFEIEKAFVNNMDPGNQ